MRLYVGNVPFDMETDELRAMFERCGTVTYAMVCRHPGDNSSRGYAFVSMPHDSEARLAIDELNHLNVSGRWLIVDQAREQRS